MRLCNKFQSKDAGSIFSLSATCNFVIFQVAAKECRARIASPFQGHSRLSSRDAMLQLAEKVSALFCSVQSLSSFSFLSVNEAETFMSFQENYIKEIVTSFPSRKISSLWAQLRSVLSSNEKISLRRICQVLNLFTVRHVRLKLIFFEAISSPFLQAFLISPQTIRPETYDDNVLELNGNLSTVSVTCR